MKISPIKKRKREKVEDEKRLTIAQFKNLINDIYDLMLDYARMRKQYLTKDNPLLVGNVEFWFHTTEEGDHQIQYSKPPPSWDEALMRSDIELHLYGLYHKPIN